MYRDGQGAPQNTAEALKWFQKAAEQGHALAYYNIGSLYHNGDGVPQNTAEAITWYWKAFDQGYFTAQESLRQAIEELQYSAEQGKYPITI